MLEAWRRRAARWIAPKPARVAVRQYAGARTGDLTGGFGTGGDTSADTELSQGLQRLRARSRQLMRDAPYARRARVIVVNNVVGAGVGLQAQVENTRDALHQRINADIERSWEEWSCAENCHTGGALHFSDFERACMSEVFTAGEVFVRKHYRTVGRSQVPLALELIESERILDDYQMPQGASANTRLGIEVDDFGRPIAYWVRDRHQGERRLPNDAANKIRRVPADQILHLRIVDRWPMTRGEPWLHSVLRKLNDMEQYSGAELTAARMSANYFATLESPNEDPLPTDKQADGTKSLAIEPGMIDQLSPGDQLKFHAPNRPNTALPEFMRHMLREVAAGIGTSYESLSRDYSQSNYSSSRLALLDDRDLWRVLQQWWARSFRSPLHRAWMQPAVLSRAISSIPIAQFAIDPERFLDVRWKFRGWSWVDPTKEVEAYKEAVKAGFTTVSAVIAATGGGVDIEDVIAERREELAMFDEADIEVDTTVAEAQTTPPAPAGSPVAKDDTTDPPAPARVVSIAR
jgi:lambda family phage portal protein